MKSVVVASRLAELRKRPMWSLLAADHAHVYIAQMKALLYDNEKMLTRSTLVEKMSAQLERLRSAGYEFEKASQYYINHWLSESWVSRRLGAEAREEEYELTPDSIAVIRLFESIENPRSAVTESRLAMVTRELSELSEATDANQSTRLKALYAERDRINREIEDVGRGIIRTLPEDRALERIREIIAISDDLTGDFRKVRNGFERLNRTLREDIVNNDGSRSDVLEKLFAGIDVINESEEGKTFLAFWRMLTSTRQSSEMEDALREITTRPFAGKLSPKEVMKLRRLTSTLMDEGASVHGVLQKLASSLRTFVTSREYQENRRVNALLRDASSMVMGLKNRLRPGTPIDFSITSQHADLRSISQRVLFDPSPLMVSAEMNIAETSQATTDDFHDLVMRSEIDIATLKEYIREYLKGQETASVADLLQIFPAEQGLGSVMGYLWLGMEDGSVIDGEKETVSWIGQDGETRTAEIGKVIFSREEHVG